MATLAFATSRSSSLKMIMARSSTSRNHTIRVAGPAASFSSSPIAAASDTHYNQSRKPTPYKLGKHRSNALELLQQQPVIEVEGDMAICDGGGGALGHPLEYIKVGNRADYESPEEVAKGVACIYCGLRYRKKTESH